MSKPGILFTDFSFNLSRLRRLSFICTFALGLSLNYSQLASAQHDPSKYEAIFGDPNQFVSDFEADLSPKLNEYMGLGIAVSGFILVIRSLMH